MNLKHENLPVITNKYEPYYKRCRSELVDKADNQLDRRFLRNNLGLKVIMDCRTDKSCNFK